MSMLCSLYRLNQAQTMALAQSPQAVCELLGYAPAPAPKPGFLTRLFGKPRPEQVPAAPKLEPVAESETFELHQAWHILHYLFSGTDAEGDWPGAFIMSGRQEVGPDLGYGPARLLDSSLCRQVAEFLAAQSREALDAAYAADAIDAEKIYWQVSPEPSVRQQQVDELWSMVREMRTFFERTADTGSALLIHIY